MYREIKIGKSTIPMLANGATPIRYRMVFGKDIISEFQSANEDGGRVSSTISELAYIMAMAAESKDGKVNMSKLNLESFMEWLEGFEPLDITMAAEEIVDVYMSNQETHSEIKKKVKESAKEK